MNKKPRIAIRAIITNAEGKVLILKRENTKYCEGLWNLPGGKLEYNETVESALTAEVREETGLTVTGFNFFSYLDNLPGKKGELHYITLVFICRTVGTVKLSPESSEYRWIGNEELKDFEMAFRNGEAVREFFSINQPFSQYSLW